MSIKPFIDDVVEQNFQNMKSKNLEGDDLDFEIKRLMGSLSQKFFDAGVEAGRIQAEQKFYAKEKNDQENKTEEAGS